MNNGENYGISCYYIKLKSRLSVRLSVHLRHGIISVVSAWIDLGLGICIAESIETCIDIFFKFSNSSLLGTGALKRHDVVKFAVIFSHGKT